MKNRREGLAWLIAGTMSIALLNLSGPVWSSAHPALEGVKELEGRGLVTAGETDIDLGETAQTAVEMGVEVTAVAEPHTTAGIVDAIVKLWEEK